MGRITKVHEPHNRCRNCRLRTLCLPENLPQEDVRKLESIVQRQQPVARGEYLFHAGEHFREIYAVHTGSVKTSTLMPDGDEHIASFHWPGDVIGLDAIVSSNHSTSAVALETTSLCAIPYARLSTLSEQTPALQQQLMHLMSRELLEEKKINHLLSRGSAEQRLSFALLRFSRQFSHRGHSGTHFRLPMSRHDLGNYLGLVPETMSRTFRRLEQQGIIQADGKAIEIVNRSALHERAFGLESQQAIQA